MEKKNGVSKGNVVTFWQWVGQEVRVAMENHGT